VPFEFIQEARPEATGAFKRMSNTMHYLPHENDREYCCDEQVDDDEHLSLFPLNEIPPSYEIQFNQYY